MNHASKVVDFRMELPQQVISTPVISSTGRIRRIFLNTIFKIYRVIIWGNKKFLYLQPV